MLWATQKRDCYISKGYQLSSWRIVVKQPPGALHLWGALELYVPCPIPFHKGCAQLFTHVWSFATPWVIACQAPLSMGFSKQEYWSGLPFPAPADLLDPEIKSKPLLSPVLAGAFSTTEPPGKPSSTRHQLPIQKIRAGCTPFLCTSTRRYKAIKGMPTQYSKNISPSEIWKKTFTGPRFSQNPDVTVNIPRDNLKIAMTLKTSSPVNTAKKK